MRFAILGLFPAATLFAGCVAFAPPPSGSHCAAQSAEFRWLNPPARPEIESRGASRPHYDKAVGDPAFSSGVKVSGRVEFDWRGRGRHFLEIFLMNPEADRHTFRLAAGGRELDARPLIAPGPGRMRPKRNLRYTSLLAMVDGPARLTVESDAPSYALAAARWTRAAAFESEDIPRYLERSRFLETHILLEADGERPMSRRQYLQHLGDRLAFSSRPDVRKTGLLDRVRAWFWLAMENHEPDDVLQAHVLFQEGLKLMPENPVLRQTVSASCIGQVVKGKSPHGDYCQSVAPVPWNVDVPAPSSGAPAWAVEQRNLMRRMDALTRWWVEKRQARNGELGGEWGDDVEILRYWGPQALGFGSSVAALGIRREALGIWTSGTLLDGYNKGVTDVEHSSEPTTDTQPLGAALDPDSKEARARLAATAACADHWIARQPDGMFRFRSTWFNCREADTSPSRAVDVHLNTRAMGPALWHAYLSRDPKSIALIAHWADSWIRAMRSTAAGKPAGIFPSAMRSADGQYLIGPAWDKPEAEWDYFQWSGGSQEALTSLVLAVYDLTGDRKYLDAATESFLPMLDCGGRPELCRAIRSAPEAFYAWRQVTADPRLDKAFEYRPQPPDAEALDEMARLARESDQRFSVNWDILTSEVLYTDRVYYPMPPEYRWGLFGGEAPRGDRYPTFAVTWPAANAEFARAVLAASASGARFRLYGFDAAERSVPIRFWRLKPGPYKWSAAGRSGTFTVARLPHTESFPLPPGREVTLSVAK